eukprot:8422339-Alexandrium_andersonii.AAC.1
MRLGFLSTRALRTRRALKVSKAVGMNGQATCLGSKPPTLGIPQSMLVGLQLCGVLSQTVEASCQASVHCRW